MLLFGGCLGGPGHRLHSIEGQSFCERKPRRLSRRVPIAGVADRHDLGGTARCST
ncbi:hypothetical protein AWT69_000600 [Pseudomonas putida]|nr:hypothetical protein AWT69_000600 [Pseudomonas putida]